MDFKTFSKLAQEARKKKITPKQLSEWGKMSVQKRTKGMSKEEKSEYFKKIRAGIKVGEKNTKKLPIDKPLKV